jgi:hypothetical protein
MVADPMAPADWDWEVACQTFAGVAGDRFQNCFKDASAATESPGRKYLTTRVYNTAMSVPGHQLRWPLSTHPVALLWHRKWGNSCLLVWSC